MCGDRSTVYRRVSFGRGMTPDMLRPALSPAATTWDATACRETGSNARMRICAMPCSVPLLEPLTWLLLLLPLEVVKGARAWNTAARAATHNDCRKKVFMCTCATRSTEHVFVQKMLRQALSRREQPRGGAVGSDSNEKRRKCSYLQRQLTSSTSTLFQFVSQKHFSLGGPQLASHVVGVETLPLLPPFRDYSHYHY